MEVYCKGQAEIRHAKSRKIYKIDCTDLDWDQVGAEERSMGSEIHYEAMLEHSELGTLAWGIWEYPVGVENYQSTDVGDHEVMKDFDYGLEHTPSEADEYDWLNQDAPSDPYIVFINSHRQASDLLTKHGETQGTSLLNRMIFSNQITALEAYLCDTLINEVKISDGSLERLIAKANELADAKFTLSEIYKSPTLVSDTAIEYLRSVLYHNLAKVDVLYKIALGFNILSLSDDISSLFKAVSLRHDCVHRNGFKKDGNQHTAFTKTYVEATGDLIFKFVEKIQRNLPTTLGGTSL
ncbi:MULTISPECIES: hypothetical protein [Xanthomonas]|uniref:RiboL-PSP-HEPN domain-containing protein n=1 Tax=Xanthomonas dyei TaxID=743699 RepID=A0ABZ0DEP7_9XANT|nr:hypothetical protein [Xanthomonas dyei]WOB26946.1 hypothetical protein NYR99_02870 [Xanthomonas dyei]WOB54566.1 hypothetical protein NYR95_02875 [Xanthomonas dyei]